MIGVSILDKNPRTGYFSYVLISFPTNAIIFEPIALIFLSVPFRSIVNEFILPGTLVLFS